MPETVDLSPLSGVPSGAALGDARMISYDTERYPFAALACEALGVDDLRRLHEADAVGVRGRPPRYQDNLELRKLLGHRLCAGRFPEVYKAMVGDVIGPLFARRLAYSNTPQFRVHLAGGPSASGWHVDHQVIGRTDQISVWLPFVDTWGTNTLWVESDYELADYRPISVKYGEMLLFDGTWLSHGTLRNDTGHTRVSIDFRVAPRQRGALERFLPSQARRTAALAKAATSGTTRSTRARTASSTSSPTSIPKMPSGGATSRHERRAPQREHEADEDRAEDLLRHHVADPVRDAAADEAAPAKAGLG